jgi:hypothetical protein
MLQAMFGLIGMRKPALSPTKPKRKDARSKAHSHKPRKAHSPKPAVACVGLWVCCI